MSDNPLLGRTGFGNTLAVPAPTRVKRAPAGGPAGPHDYGHNQMRAHVGAAMIGMTPDEIIQHRDTIGPELEAFASFAQDPGVTRKDVENYFGKLTGNGTITPEDALAIMQTMPKDSAQIQDWAGLMFGALMHTSIHAHAAYPRELYPGPGAQPQPAPQQPEEAQEPEQEPAPEQPEGQG